MRESPAAAVGLALVVATGVWLRFWRLSWGLDQGLPSTDEWAWAAWLAPFAHVGPEAFRSTELVYPTGYRFAAGIAAAGAHALGLIGPPEPPGAPWWAAVRVARWVAASASVVGILATWRAGTLLAGRRAGWLAAACLAAVPFDAMQVHYASVDPLLACTTACALWASLRLGAAGLGRDAVLAGLCAGLAFASKYTGGLALVPVGWACLERARAGRRPVLALRLGLLAAAGAVLGVALACPTCLARPDLVAVSVAGHARNVAQAARFWNNHLTPTLGWWGRPWLYQLVAALPYTLGVALWAQALVGVVVAVRRRTRGDRIVLALLLPCFLVLGGSAITQPRYLLPLFPPLAVLAGRALAGMTRWRLVTALTLAYSLALSASQVARFSWDNVATVAQWVAAHPPPTAGGAPPRVAFPAHIDSVHLPRLLPRLGLVPVPRPELPWTLGAPDAIVVPDWYATHLQRDLPASAQAEALAALESGRAQYTRVAAFPARPYLQRWLDVRLDPAFAGDLWQGDPGFVVYYREPASGGPGAGRGSAAPTSTGIATASAPSSRRKAPVATCSSCTSSR